jgi:hypothetical protein
LCLLHLRKLRKLELRGLRGRHPRGRSACCGVRSAAVLKDARDKVGKVAERNC